MELVHKNGLWIGRFSAMASLCELLMDIEDRALAVQLLSMAKYEVKRIEHKFSRYRKDNIIYRINNADGHAIEVDNETALLLDYADQCYQLSEGRFDITSGVLREIWQFDGGSKVPSISDVNETLSRVGWARVKWDSPILQMLPGMEIDLGGIGKEYAADRVSFLLQPHIDGGVLINFGGDLCALGTRADGSAWEIAIDDPDNSGNAQQGIVSLKSGAVATSGDARRYLIKDGVRYGHILDPLTGWPVPDAPHSVTTVASTCMEAGMLSTFAILRGGGAEAFLKQQGVEYLCL